MTSNHTLGEAEASGSTNTSPQIPRPDYVSPLVDEVEVDERVPLLPEPADLTTKGKGKGKEKKPFYRARPLW